jgi:hypothetical protein
MEDNARHTNRSFKQLRYVSKQLYVGTMGMELQLTSVQFDAFLVSAFVPVRIDRPSPSTFQTEQEFSRTVVL